MFCKVEGSKEVARGSGHLLIDAKSGPRARNLAHRVSDGEGGLKLLQLILCGLGAGRPKLLFKLRFGRRLPDLARDGPCRHEATFVDADTGLIGITSYGARGGVVVLRLRLCPIWSGCVGS